MSYKLSAVTIRTNNTTEGMEKISELWRDITSGKLPILFDSQQNFQAGISPISMYNNYSTDESGDYDLSVLGVTGDFFKQMESLVLEGRYKKYDVTNDDGNIEVCTRQAWEKVWQEQKSGKIKRRFTKDYESAVPPQYTKDGKAHCYLYIAI